MVQYNGITTTTKTGVGVVVKVNFANSTDKGAGYTALHRLHDLSQDLSLDKNTPNVIEVTFREEINELEAQSLVADALK